MTLRVAINGFGRIGRNVLRGWISRGADTDLEIVGMNSHITYREISLVGKWTVFCRRVFILATRGRAIGGGS